MASRKVFDCRDFPGPCSLVVAGEEKEVWQAQVAHTISVHEQVDGPELRELLEQYIHDESDWLAAQVAASGASS